MTRIFILDHGRKHGSGLLENAPGINPLPLSPCHPRPLRAERAMHLYIHIPFCHRICPYCAFYKHTLAGHDVNAFVRALSAQARTVATEFTPGPVRTIHFGGGTPSLLKPSQIEAIIQDLHAAFDLSSLEEFALEANPSTFNLAKAQAWQRLGVSRVSLGVQSFQPELLSTLGRDHSPTEAIEAFEFLRAANIPQVSLDLMFSLPNQSLEHWRSDLQQALALAPDHLSAYNLTWEEDTEFLERLRRGEYAEAPERDADHFNEARELLTVAGYEHYEISNYARPGARSLHNQAYWQGADYLSLGPGAVSTWQRRRWKNLPDTLRWTQLVLGGEDPRTELEELDDEALRLEQIALGLRTREGIDLSLIGSENRTALPLLAESGLLLLESERIRLTASGMALADELTLQLV